MTCQQCITAAAGMASVLNSLLCALYLHLHALVKPRLKYEDDSEYFERHEQTRLKIGLLCQCSLAIAVQQVSLGKLRIRHSLLQCASSNGPALCTNTLPVTGQAKHMVAQVQQARTSSLYSKHPQHKLHRIAANLPALVDIMACCKKVLQQLISKSSVACSSLLVICAEALTALLVCLQDWA